MIIILEGPDGAGKTTLAKELVRQTKGIYLHLSYRWPQQIFLYHTAAIRYAARQERPVIIDRWWPSEAIYATSYRGQSPWPLQGRMADRVARKHGALYIYCLPENVEEHCNVFLHLKKQREEMYDDIYEVTHKYMSLWYGNQLHEKGENYIDFVIRNGGLQDRGDHLRYNIEEHGHYIDLFAERAIDMAKITRELQYQPALQYSNFNILGNTDMLKYLFVGEQVNPKYRELYWPFYEYKNSSLYLTQCMQAAEIPEEGIMWCNAYNHDESINENIKPIVEQYKPRVITFGAHAAEAMAKLGVETYDELVHPSYAKRFGKVNLMEVMKDVILCE
tara:strand:+ start:7968 stop:8966 length:999 start_codon:yes stop_codon:yes gene_type:complete